MLTVKPPEYYPIVEKLFALRIKDAFEVLGASLEEMIVAVKPEDRTIKLAFYIKIRESGTLFSIGVDTFVKGLLEKLASDATLTFGKLYGVQFLVSGFKVEEHFEKEKGQGPKLIVNAPEDLHDSLERLGKGLVITLKEWGIEVSSMIVGIKEHNVPLVRIVVRLERRISSSEKEDLKKKILEKARSYIKVITKRAFPLDVEVLDPEDRVIGIVMKKQKELEREAEELAQKQEIKELMEMLGKSSPGS